MGREEERKRAIDLSPVFLGNPAPSWKHNMAEAPAFSFLPSLLLFLFLLEYPAGSFAEERATEGLVSCWVSEWPRHSPFNKKASYNYFSQLEKK